MEKVIHDSGVIRVVMRPLRNNIDEIPMRAAWWTRQYEAEPYRFAQGIASAIDGGSGNENTILYWQGRTNFCIVQGLALGLFVGSKPGSEWVYGAPCGGLLAMVDSMSTDRCILDYCAGTTFAENSRDELLAAGRAWAAGMGRQLVQKRVITEWVPV